MKEDPETCVAVHLPHLLIAIWYIRIFMLNFVDIVHLTQDVNILIYLKLRLFFPIR